MEKTVQKTAEEANRKTAQDPVLDLRSAALRTYGGRLFPAPFPRPVHEGT